VPLSSFSYHGRNLVANGSGMWPPSCYCPRVEPEAAKDPSHEARACIARIGRESLCACKIHCRVGPNKESPLNSIRADVRDRGISKAAGPSGPKGAVIGPALRFSDEKERSTKIEKTAQK
jgi:hypothetical protein